MKKELFLQIVRSKAKVALTPEEEGMFGSIGEAIEKAFESDSVERAKQITAITNQLGTIDDGETLSGIIRALAGKIDSVEAIAKRGLNEREKNSLRAVLEANKDVIRNSRRKDAPAWEVEFKAKRAASALMTTATLLTGASAINNPNELDDLTITFIQYPKNFILDAVNSRQVSKVPASRKWKEQIAANDGVIAVVAEGTEKPLVDYKFEWKYSYRKKYAGRIEMTEEDEIDMEQLMMEIITMFERDVLKAWQDGVLADINTWVNSYTSTALDDTIVKPTVYSVIGAGKLACQVNNYEPDVVFINPADAAEAIYLQDNNGAQQFIPSDLQFGGLRPFVTNKVAAGTIIVGTSAIVEEQHGAFIIRRGTYGTQFIENEFTIVGEVFSNLKLPTESKKGWVKLDVATVKGLLLKPTGN
jgi:hypothetical protein